MKFIITLSVLFICNLSFATCPETCQAFIRGDANNDGSINISDVIYISNWLFLGGPAPIPMDSGDANDDGTVNLSDVIYLASYISSGGPAPPEPFNGGAGFDCTPDSIDPQCDGLSSPTDYVSSIASNTSLSSSYAGWSRWDVISGTGNTMTRSITTSNWCGCGHAHTKDRFKLIGTVGTGGYVPFSIRKIKSGAIKFEILLRAGATFGIGPCTTSVCNAPCVALPIFLTNEMLVDYDNAKLVFLVKNTAATKSKVITLPLSGQMLFVYYVDGQGCIVSSVTTPTNQTLQWDESTWPNLEDQVASELCSAGFTSDESIIISRIEVQDFDYIFDPSLSPQGDFNGYEQIGPHPDGYSISLEDFRVSCGN